VIGRRRSISQKCLISWPVRITLAIANISSRSVRTVEWLEMKIKAARSVASKKITPKKRERSPSASRRPFLVIDGDSFVHRFYHALRKTILRHGQRLPVPSSASMC